MTNNNNGVREYLLAELVGGQSDGKIVLVDAGTHEFRAPVSVGPFVVRDMNVPRLDIERYVCGQFRTIVLIDEYVMHDLAHKKRLIDYYIATGKTTRFYLEGMGRTINDDPVDRRKAEEWLLRGLLDATNKNAAGEGGNS